MAEEKVPDVLGVGRPTQDEIERERQHWVFHDDLPSRKCRPPRLEKAGNASGVKYVSGGAYWSWYYSQGAWD